MGPASWRGGERCSTGTAGAEKAPAGTFGGGHGQCTDGLERVLAQGAPGSGFGAQEPEGTKCAKVEEQKWREAKGKVKVVKAGREVWE